MEKKPIYTILSFPPEEIDNIPKSYGWNTTEKLGPIHNELGWRLVDFCRIHQIVYQQINKSNKKLDEIEIEPFTANPMDIENLGTARRMSWLIGKEFEHKRIINFVDHMTVVGLWAICEQFLGKIYRAYISEKDNIEESTISAPYRWNDFLSSFSDNGIDLTTCDNYSNANECRALNNAIKHEPKVTERLTQFDYFTNHLNKELEEIELEMQRYLNGVSDFLGSLIEKGSGIIKNAP
tara:strand:- start:137 stop:847 length:711 start_codon:yes stop_codon:yes gene_type:complete